MLLGGVAESICDVSCYDRC